AGAKKPGRRANPASAEQAGTAGERAGRSSDKAASGKAAGGKTAGAKGGRGRKAGGEAPVAAA
ncbi:hypothetical protein, partial [Paraburkholderia tropica]|uniref:hypothetical protein n=1 Tax=Paraburkholderia tropica TaxID=92647 RepID=UPI003F55860C